MVDPNAVESIRSAILKILSDDNFSQELVRKGIKNSSLYSVTMVANEHLQEYKKVVSLN